MPAIETIEQDTTFIASAQLMDEDGDALLGANVSAMVLEVIETRTKTVLRSTRDALNANDVTVDAAGVITWLGQLEDSRIVNTDTRFGAIERHVAQFEFAHNAAVDETGTDLIDTVLDDNTVTLTVAGHGIVDTDIDEDHIFVLSAEDVGGLNLNGRHKITSAPTSSTLTIEHKCPATAAANGGGAVSFWINSRLGVARIEFPVRRNRRDC